MAGSGKSTLTQQLRRELALKTINDLKPSKDPKCNKEDPLLLGVYCNLPTMKNPLTALMQEALAREYNLSKPQIKSLKEKAASGKVLLVILCDAGNQQFLRAKGAIPLTVVLDSR